MIPNNSAIDVCYIGSSSSRTLASSVIGIISFHQTINRKRSLRCTPIITCIVPFKNTSARKTITKTTARKCRTISNLTVFKPGTIGTSALATIPTP